MQVHTNVHVHACTCSGRCGNGKKEIHDRAGVQETPFQPSCHGNEGQNNQTVGKACGLNTVNNNTQ